MHEATILDFEVGASEVHATVRVGDPTSGGVPVEISTWVFGNSDFQVQLESTMNIQ